MAVAFSISSYASSKLYLRVLPGTMGTNRSYMWLFSIPSTRLRSAMYRWKGAVLARTVASRLS